jgi:hypothetical protein
MFTIEWNLVIENTDLKLFMIWIQFLKPVEEYQANVNNVIFPNNYVILPGVYMNTFVTSSRNARGRLSSSRYFPG